MIDSESPVIQTLLGTLFTWGMTAAGAGLVVIISGTQLEICIFLFVVIGLYVSKRIERSNMYFKKFHNIRLVDALVACLIFAIILDFPSLLLTKFGGYTLN